ncbi:hypothetical protein NHX12_021796 [Muraenolepis orangiensis]|uniref:Uncharacterized protein n=1 Tax=Muraenolepis orangiensis TaxID=630683 RepID=A0A9Q0EQN3_9TELE|nr:hypothetical protein NHX12_021796 [Muraenolepis orangiensis]
MSHIWFETPAPSSSAGAIENDFFAFDEEDTASFNSDTEVIEYLKSGSEMEILDRFPTIKTIVCTRGEALQPGQSGANSEEEQVV